tara:strand:- start:600 stop:782 length:183 start_codon:yes stop_codon:yes gene_type:complete
MDIKKLIEESKSTTENLTAVINFKLDPQMKQSFVDYSVKNNVSMGLLMRNIIKAILEEVR